MTLQETIECLEIAKAEIEWNYPMDYCIALDNAINILKPLRKGEDKEMVDFKRFKVKIKTEFEYYKEGSDLIFDFGTAIEEATEFMKIVMCHLDNSSEGKTSVILEREDNTVSINCDKDENAEENDFK